MIKLTLLISLVALGAQAYPNPQADDLLKSIEGLASQDGERYGGIDSDISPADLAEIFGVPQKPFEIVPDQKDDDDQKDEKFNNNGVPTEIIVDDVFDQCSSYADSGYRCVPYYSCDGGEIIIDGAGLINPRFGGLNDVELNPETSKCPGSFEMCCRHPDWFGLPILTPVQINKPDEDILINNDVKDNDQQTGKDTDQDVEIFDQDTGIQDQDSGLEDQDSGIQDQDSGVYDQDTGAQDQDTGAQDQDSGVYDQNTGVIDQDSEDQDEVIDNSGGIIEYDNENGDLEKDTDDDLQNGKDSDDESEFPNSNTIPNVTPGYQPHCGRRNANGVGVRIASNDPASSETQFGEWPHMCAVLNRTLISGIEHSLFLCGGSLIAPNVILTGAHCVDTITDVSSLLVRCGEWDTRDEVEPSSHQDRAAFEVKIHPGYVKRTLANDFAIIVMQDEFTLARHIDTICLPDQFEQNFNWQDCVATGWGKDQFNKEGEYQVIMKQIQMDMVDYDTCQDKLRSTRLGQFFQLDKSFNCAGGQGGKDTCTGDGGGPLMCPGYDGYYYQTGITAWGIECGTAGVPGVYANVTEGLCFIDYATRCVLGEDADYYGIKGCKRWGKRRYCELKDELDSLEILVDQTTVLREKGKLFRKARDIKKLIPLYEDMVKGCKPEIVDIDCLNFDYFPEAEEIDISIHAKIDEDDLRSEEIPN